MPTNTYVALDKKTITTAVASVEFTSVPQGYTDLVLVMNGNTDAATTTKLNVGNGSIDTGANYSWTVISGTGGAANSYRESSVNFTQNERYANWDASNNANTIINLQNYSNTTTNKTWLTRGNNAAAGVDAIVGLWRNTSAINIIRVSCTNAGRTFSIGTTFSLYGIKAWAPEVTPKATGGYVYEDSTYYYHSFPFSSTFTPNQSLTADILVVAGGGASAGGAAEPSGGAGAGGVIYFAGQSLTATNYTCTIGAGGSGGNDLSKGTDGVQSSFGALTVAVGGGAGGWKNQSGGLGNAGGSGGGGSGWGDPSSRSGGSSTQTGTGATAYYGYAGGTGRSGSTLPYSSAGGGGAGEVGANADTGRTGGGNGGNGTSAFSSWCSATGMGEGVDGIYYIAGGGGGTAFGGGAPGKGGYGGGGAGAITVVNSSGYNGLVSTGGGGGAASGNGRGGAGGSGIVIVRYAK